jgi:hypothetical protein
MVAGCSLVGLVLTVMLVGPDHAIDWLRTWFGNG